MSARLVQKTALAAGIRGDLNEGERKLAFSGHSLRAGLASSAKIEEDACADAISATPAPKFRSRPSPQRLIRRPRGSRPSPLKRRTIQRSPLKKTRQLCEKLVGVKKIDEAIKLQSDFAKSAYEDFVAQATRVGRDVFEPRQGISSRRSTAASPAQPSVVAQPWQAAATPK